MKLYLSCDMEGTAGVCAWQQCDPSDVHEYPIYRRYMTQEVRAAVDGARSAGAGEILVNDSHWAMRNLLWDELPNDEWLRVISGTPKPLSMGQGLDASFDAVFFTGYHGMAGDASVLSHTSSPETIYDVSINGTRCSEALLYAALAGSLGVPVLLITGDRAIVDDVVRALPWAVGVAVKHSIGYAAAHSLSPQTAREAIHAGAKEALARVEAARPFTFDAPFELRIETVTVEQAEYIALLPGFERIGARTMRFRAGDYAQVLRAFIVATRLGSAANAS